MISGLIILVLGAVSGGVPCEGVISGQVIDARSGAPLDRARVEGGENVTPVRTDAKGNYRLGGLCSGPIKLRVVRADYALRVVEVTVGGEHAVNIELVPIYVAQGDDVRVAAPRLKASDTRSVVALEGDALLRTRGENLADALANLPGVTVLRSGTTAKPVIRGQYGSRVLKLYDDVRHEGQDWGLDHGPEIDAFATGSMRVVKGSAGVRYGPDAIAGVLLIDPPELLKEPGVAIHTQTVGALNGKRGTFATRIDGNHNALEGLSWRLDGNYSRGAGVMTPNYPLDNTGVEETNLGGIIEYEGDCWRAKLSYRHHSRRAGACLCVRNEATSDFDAQLTRDRPVNSELYRADYEIERPFGEVSHDTVLLRTEVELAAVGELETTYAFQINDRKEYDIVRVETDVAQYNFELRSHTVDALLRRTPRTLGDGRRLEGLLGVGGMVQENVYRGAPFLSDYRALSGGVFTLERLIMGDLELEAGLRYDHETRNAYIPVKTYEGLVREERIATDLCEVLDEWSRCSSTFNVGTLSLGALFRMSEEYVAKVDLSSATRIPTIDEQYINGTSPSFPIMARGRASLGPETSWSLSGTLEANLSWLSGELSIYGSYIDGYIYLSPELRDDGTVRTDVLINGRFPRFSYDPIDAIFYGVDANAKARFGPFDLGVQGSVVRATRTDRNQFLLFIPSDRVRTELTYHLPEGGPVVAPHVSVSAHYIARQYNVSPEVDFAPVPGSYVLLGGRIGATFEWNQQRYTFDMEAQNALNTAYRDYTSLLRYYADEPGRQIFVRFGTEMNL